MFQNSLALINKGSNSIIYWEAGDHSWSRKEWGLLDRNGNPKPVYKVLSSLFRVVSDGSPVLAKSWEDPQLTMAVFPESKRLVIALANVSNGELVRSLSFKNWPQPSKLDIFSSESGAVEVRLLPGSRSDCRLRIRMKRQTAVTIVAR